jgi:hypothetical protein
MVVNLFNLGILDWRGVTEEAEEERIYLLTLHWIHTFFLNTLWFNVFD